VSTVRSGERDPKDHGHEKARAAPCEKALPGRPDSHVRWSPRRQGDVRAGIAAPTSIAWPELARVLTHECSCTMAGASALVNAAPGRLVKPSPPPHDRHEVQIAGVNGTCTVTRHAIDLASCAPAARNVSRRPPGNPPSSLVGKLKGRWKRQPDEPSYLAGVKRRRILSLRRQPPTRGWPRDHRRPRCARRSR
jgi:hypothetical protein